MTTTIEDRLYALRSRYSDSTPFSEERNRLWAEIQEFERGMDPYVIRRVIEWVIFGRPEPRVIPLGQVELDLAA